MHSITTQFLRTHPHWTHEPERDALQRAFLFADFMQAFAFMTQMAIFAEKNNHHPEWFNVYNRVDITLTTHDANGVTEKDCAFARYAEQVFTQQFAGAPAN
ncbi:MAG: 4a-hydroxytetrahydrobiopterin dehydratase [Burkholderiales bacterium]|nr:4a-hydroxytetrahydrobiopterin dehydratase [Burkholderiales bacterium]